MTTSFKILFSIEVLHDFYRHGKCNDFRFVPTEQTRSLLANCRALYKTVGNRLVVLIKADENGKPFIKPPINEKFTFMVELMNSSFMTISNIEYASLSGKRFYFNNLSTNKFADDNGDDQFYLSQKAANSADATNYSERQFVVKAGEVFECIKASTGATTNNPAFWLNRHKKQYATENDLLPFITSFPAFAVSPAAPVVNMQVFKYNITNGVFDLPVANEIWQFENAVNQVSANLSQLPADRYKVLINGVEKMAYLNNEAVFKNMFGVIDIYNHLPNGDDFALLDAAGKTKDQVVGGVSTWLNFSLRFPNRTAYWKYIVQGKGVKEFDAHPVYEFTGNAAPADAFVSNFPIPLQQDAHHFKLTLFHPVSADPPLAPNPDINASGMLTKNGADYFCNIYLNY